MASSSTRRPRGRLVGRCILAALLIFSQCALGHREDDWHTNNHQPGYCAMGGVCGKRKDGDPLNCPRNEAAAQPDAALAAALAKTCPAFWASQRAEQGSYCCTADQVNNIATSTQRVVPFVVGCPACLHNFVHFWCVLSCSPNQATFTDVVAVQAAYDTNKTVVSELNYWVDEKYGEDFYNSCKDVKFGAANVPAMSFIGGGATNFQEWGQFLGLVKDKRFPPIGSPFQINFRPGASTPEGMAPLATAGDMVSCADPAFRCSCSDCPAGPDCDQGGGDDTGDDSQDASHTCRVGRLSCWDFSLIWVYVAGVALIVACFGRQAIARAVLRSRWGSSRAAARLLQPLLAEDEATGATLPKVQQAELLTPYSVGLEAEPNPLQDMRVHYPWMEHKLQQAYYQLGKLCALNPWRTLGLGVLLVVCCSLGLLRFRVETAPERLWVGPRSQAAQEAAAFTDSFGPFYRVTQLILTTTPDAEGPYKSASPQHLPSILTRANLELLFDMHDLVQQIEAAATLPAGTAEVSLSDVCYKPFGDLCAIQSVLQYWQLDRQLFDKEQDKRPGTAGQLSVEYCLAHWTTECRSAYGAPMDPIQVLGGFPRDKAQFRNYSADATSLVVTLPLSSKAATQDAAAAWEAAFLQLAADKLAPMAAAHNLTLSYSAQRSVQDELSRESGSDAVTVAASYVAMLVYIAVALTSLPPKRQLARIFVLSRVGLGLGGVLIVAGSVCGALGLISAGGMWSTLIIMEVIPFLALAVGVDNMFILVYALQRQDASVPLVERVAGALAASGPSITLAAGCEISAFALGALSPMPAVRNFSVCAAAALALDLVLQVTVFVALLTLDTRRVEQHRADLAPCVTIKPKHQPLYAPRAYGGADPVSDGGGAPQLQPSGLYGAQGVETWMQQALHQYMHMLHIPALQQRAVQAGVLLLFFTGLIFSLVVTPRLSVGLDQAVALPRDSYLQQYFSDISTQLRVGPPLYLVVRGLNTSTAAPDLSSVCGVSGCHPHSLANQVAAAARHPHKSMIATGVASWVDDFTAWLNPGLTKCCRVHTGSQPTPVWLGWLGLGQGRVGEGGGFCPAPDQPPCSTDPQSCQDCRTCIAHPWPGGRPDTPDFQQYLPWFLQAKPSEACAKGGAGAYTDLLAREGGPDTPPDAPVAGLSQGMIASSAFRAFYAPLNEQQEFISALRSVRQLVDNLQATLGLDVYPYSIFHVFFEQYLYAWRDAAILLAAPLVVIALITALLTSSLWSAGLLMLVLASLLLHLMGAMWLSGIQLNAVSLVNLAMALGIAVEFCAHVLHAFGVAPGTRTQRAAAALEKSGASVLSGITFTKLVGVAVLAGARTRIFELYYFRLYLALVVLGGLHGLVLLPVLLMLAGPPSWSYMATSNTRQ